MEQTILHRSIRKPFISATPQKLLNVLYLINLLVANLLLVRTVSINDRKVSISQTNTVFPMKNNLLIPVKILLVK